MKLRAIVYKQTNNKDVSMFLGKYKNKGKLGQGGFGAVFKVSDDLNQNYALKIISLQKINRSPVLMKYLRGQIKCMQTMDSPYLIKLYKVEQYKGYMYLLTEYCEGGDLSVYLGELQQDVFNIEQTTSILADVVKGLEYLHGRDYLHRDIKLQNVLVKQENGKYVFKLGDFGFSKPNNQIKGTNLGTEQYKAPEIFLNKKYDYKIDMWAFGVLFFFMLNRQYPFKQLNQNSEQKKGNKLKQMATNFSYRAAVQNSQLKKMENCTNMMQQLFKKIFQPDPEKRLTFWELRVHPLFAKHFPQGNQSSKILYNKQKTPINGGNNFEENIKKEENMAPTIVMSRSHSGNQLKEEKLILGRKKDLIDFMKDNVDLFLGTTNLFENHQIMMLVFNLLKYYIVLLRQFKKDINPNQLHKLEPGRKWTQYCQSYQYGEMMAEVKGDLSKNQIKFLTIYSQCQAHLSAIKKINPNFKAAFSLLINQTTLIDSFKRSYRSSTNYIYTQLLIKLKKENAPQKDLFYLLTMVVISHAFNNIFDDHEELQDILKPYLDQKKIGIKDIDYSEIRVWLSECNASTLKAISIAVIELYFGGK